MIDLIKSYLEKRIQLVKFELIEIIANIGPGLVASFFSLVFAMMIFLMLSLALAFWLSSLFSNYAIGFALVGLLFMLLFLVFHLFFKDKIGKQVKDKIVQNAFKNSGDKKD